jgi:predicted nucleic acid-binding protein
MLTAVDSSILLEVLIDSAEHADASEAALRKAAASGSLVICECVLAEIRPALAETELIEFLGDWQIRFVASSQQSALVAGGMYAKHLRRGGRRKRIVADFLIGAHAMCHANRLLARDRGYFRDYFTNLKLIVP